MPQNIDQLFSSSLITNFFDTFPVLKLNFKSAQAFDMTSNFMFDSHSYTIRNFRHMKLNDAHTYISEWCPAAVFKKVTAGVNSVQGLADSLTNSRLNGNSVSLQNFGSLLGGNILMRNRVSYLEQGINQFLFIDDDATYAYSYLALPVIPLTLSSEDLISTTIIASDVQQVNYNKIIDSLNDRKILYSQHIKTYFDTTISITSMNPFIFPAQYDLTINDSFYSYLSSKNVGGPWVVMYHEKYINKGVVQFRAKLGRRTRA